MFGAAVGRPGRRTVPFGVAPDFWASSTLDNGPRLRTVRVPALPIDRLLVEHAPDVLVVDIEGGESDLVRTPCSRLPRAVAMELHPWIVGAGRIGAIEAFFRRNGYHRRAELCRGSMVVYERDTAATG